MEAGGFKSQDHLQLHIKFKANLDHMRLRSGRGGGSVEGGRMGDGRWEIIPQLQALATNPANPILASESTQGKESLTLQSRPLTNSRAHGMCTHICAHTGKEGRKKGLFSSLGAQKL